MAQFFGSRSKYSLRMAWVSVFGVSAYGLIGLWALYKYFGQLISHISQPGYIVVVLLVFSPIFLLIKNLMAKEDGLAGRFFQGLNGEDAVADELKKLPDAYSVYADVVVKPGQGNIDFVLVGPTGIFTIEVKSHRGIINFNGSELTRHGQLLEKDFLRQAKSEALCLHNFLKEKLGVDIYIKPAIVFSRARITFGLKPLENTYVIQKQWVQKLIASHPFYHFPKDRQQIEELLKP
ncbi:MAG: nuclease-related domain-containing protein [Candidatus Doudnabacteria bacterium]|nr:nuclease-related domain-containing protein [Candidatus Doudnabacteria bacterium]